MSLFPITRYRLFDDPFDRFFGDQLHFFDPWNDFDTSPTALMPRSFRWINEPRRLTHSSSRRNAEGDTLRTPHSEKFRVQMNVAGFNPDTIKTRVESRKVIVEAKQEDRQPGGDFSLREIRKSYDLPEHADAKNVASYVTPNHMLVIEAPIINPEMERRLQTKADSGSLAQFGQYRDPLFDYSGFLTGSEFQPRIVDVADGKKQLQMTLPMKGYRPDEIRVSVKNNDLIVQGEHNYKDKNRSERSFSTKSVTLPPGTQIEHLQSQLTDKGELMVDAPFVEPMQNKPAIK